MSDRTILWALHVIGPDDVYAAPNWATAAEAATYLEYHMTQARLRKEPDMPTVSFAVIPWPHSAESHAKDVVRWLEHYPGQTATVPEAKNLCSDCPTAGYPTDKTRCAECPRKETGALCPHGMPLAENICGPCSAGEPNRQWLIRKRGYYYRPNRAGYTANVAEAGRYTEAEAKAEAAIEPSIMQAISLNDALALETLAESAADACMAKVRQHFEQMQCGAPLDADGVDKCERLKGHTGVCGLDPV